MEGPVPAARSSAALSQGLGRLEGFMQEEVDRDGWMEGQADQDPGDLLHCLWAQMPAHPLVGCLYCRSVFNPELSHRVEGERKASCWLQTALDTMEGSSLGN